MFGNPALDLLVIYEATYILLADEFGHSRLRYLTWLRDLVRFGRERDDPTLMPRAVMGRAFARIR